MFLSFQQAEDVFEKDENLDEKGVEEGDFEGSLKFVIRRRDGVEVCFLFPYTCNVC